MPADGINRRMGFAVGLNLIFVTVEGTFGFLSNSVALIADAGHNLGDVLGLVCAWTAICLARRRPAAGLRTAWVGRRYWPADHEDGDSRRPSLSTFAVEAAIANLVAKSLVAVDANTSRCWPRNRRLACRDAIPKVRGRCDVMTKPVGSGMMARRSGAPTCRPL